MNIEFSSLGNKTWYILDDGIKYGGKKIPFSDIKQCNITDTNTPLVNGYIKIFLKDNTNYKLYFTVGRSQDAYRVIETLRSKCEPKKPSAYNNSVKSSEDDIPLGNVDDEEIMKVVKVAICAQLKCPASAQFPTDLISIVGDEQRGYQVSGFVDSQNSYGAMIRNDFSASVSMVNGFPRVSSSSVGKNANVARAKEFGKNYAAISLFTIIAGAILYFIIMAMVGL